MDSAAVGLHRLHKNLSREVRDRSCVTSIVAETNAHWIIIGLDKDLNAAMAVAASNALKFVAVRAKISKLDAYALCSVAVSFRVTQRGVHALSRSHASQAAWRDDAAPVGEVSRRAPRRRLG